MWVETKFLLKVQSSPLGKLRGNRVFKVVYRRHTNFAVESIEQFFGGNLGFGKKSSAEINRSGDLITQVFLKVTLPEVRYCGDFTNFGHVEFAWVRNIGHAIVEETELEIGGSPIDKHYGDWLQIWQDVSSSKDHEKGLAKMLGDVPELTSISTLSWDVPDNTVLKPSYTLYVPLQFYFNRNNGLALPLIALQYHQVRIYVKFRQADQCYIASDAFKSGCGNLQLDDVSLYVNYVFLDTEERRRFAQVSHEYLIEQLQFTGEESAGSSNSAKYKLNFNHPVKAIYWVTKLGNYQGGKFMTYDPVCWENARENAAKLLLLAQYDLDDWGYFQEPGGYECEGNDGRSYVGDCGVQYTAVDPSNPSEEPSYIFNDTTTAEAFDGSLLIGKLAPCVPLLKRNKDVDLKDKVEGIIRIHTDFENDRMKYPEVEKITRNDLTLHDLSVPISKYDVDNRVDYIKKFDVTVWQHNNFGLLIDGSGNPTHEAELQLNGQPRQSKRGGIWYDTVNPTVHHTKSPRDGVNVFSFALNPEEHQPSCTCNFSRIDTAQLNLWFQHFTNHKFADVFADNDNKVLIFAVNYNVLRMLSGMAGLAYSN
ncbi:capsid protein D13L [Acanthamoeba polyphaga mimivirus]|uniref:Capsid protein D13L n=2 Tax=Acanthamoeba polyphaga mimivirus TaxID=212035 RepID=F8V5W1_MIMIV|nr:capsid protein D13L [Acanthamoeba polyphaga mimivirus]AHJ40114.2 capsid protein 1 [Samba virus]